MTNDHVDLANPVAWLNSLPESHWRHWHEMHDRHSALLDEGRALGLSVEQSADRAAAILLDRS